MIGDGHEVEGASTLVSARRATLSIEGRQQNPPLERVAIGVIRPSGQLVAERIRGKRRMHVEITEVGVAQSVCVRTALLAIPRKLRRSPRLSPGLLGKQRSSEAP